MLLMLDKQHRNPGGSAVTRFWKWIPVLSMD